MDFPVNTDYIRIETERLILRRWHRRDLRDMYDYASVEGVGEMAGWPHHRSLADSRRVLRGFRKEKCCLAIYHKADKKVIGSLGLHRSWASDDDTYRFFRSKEIGYVLSRDYWGQGLMPEAVRAVIDHCFSQLDAELLTCGHFTYNNQSRRVIEKCGFKFYRTGEYNAKQLGRSFDDMDYILMK